MKENLDQWIKDAKESTPDSGEYRRLNRALLKEHILTTRPRRTRRHRVLVVAVAVAVLFLSAGQISQLGSDGFGTRKSVQPHLLGGTINIYENEFRGGGVSLPDHFTEADVEEWQRSFAAGEGTIYMATGLSYGGKTAWFKCVTWEINGKVNEWGGNPDSPPSDELEDETGFLLTYHQDLITRCQTDAPQGHLKMMIEDVLMDFAFWTYEYPGYGEVTRYVGFPLPEN